MIGLLYLWYIAINYTSLLLSSSSSFLLSLLDSFFLTFIVGLFSSLLLGSETFTFINGFLFSLLDLSDSLFSLSFSGFYEFLYKCILSSSFLLRLISSREIPTIALWTFKFRFLFFLAPSSVLIFLFKRLHATVHWIYWLLIYDINLMWNFS